MRMLRQLRLERGWTAFELARRSRVSQSDVSALECGRRMPPPDSPTLRRLARALKYQGAPTELLDEVVEDARAHVG